jgi:predicted ester cyclase
VSIPSTEQTWSTPSERLTRKVRSCWTRRRLGEIIATALPEGHDAMADTVERVRRHLEMLNGPDAEHAYDGLFADDAVRHGFGSAGDLVQIRSTDLAFFRAFPDHHREIQLVFGDDKHVATIVEFSGTWQDSYNGFPPNGNRFSVQGLNIFRFDDTEHVVEVWQSGDTVSLLRQLGIMQ